MNQLKPETRTSSLIEQPISVVQQVQFAQAILILVGIILGNSVSEWFYLLDISVGISLLVSSLLGKCIWSGLFRCLPWNRPVPRRDQ